MNSFRLSLQVLALPITLFAMLAQPPNIAAQDRVTVQPRRVLLIRSEKVMRDFPERKKAIVRYPIVSGLSDATVLRRIQNTLSMKNVFDVTLEEYRRNSGLLEFDYKVNYNKHYLLRITFTQDVVGAYPTTETKHFLINLKNGKVIKAGDAFNPDSLATLATMANQNLKAEARERIKDVEGDKESNNDQKISLKKRLDRLTFTVENLDEFSVSDKGVTFLYDAGFPHLIRALQPDGNYFFSYAELRRYIKSNGPLGIFK